MNILAAAYLIIVANTNALSPLDYKIIPYKTIEECEMASASFNKEFHTGSSGCILGSK